MRIAVISDTHNAVSSTEKVLAAIKNEGIDTIIHCGDMTYPSTAELFRDFCVYHAWGNGDIDTIELPMVIKACKPGSRSEQWIKCELDGKLIGAVHDIYSSYFRTMLGSGEFDYIFVGHTHRKMDEMMGPTRVINPGSIGGAPRAPYGYCILDLKTGDKKDLFLD